MSKIATSAGRGSRRDDVIGKTSDGVKILRPPRGPRNLSDVQVREIARALRDAVARRRGMPQSD